MKEDHDKVSQLPENLKTMLEEFKEKKFNIMSIDTQIRILDIYCSEHPDCLSQDDWMCLFELLYHSSNHVLEQICFFITKRVETLPYKNLKPLFKYHAQKMFEGDKQNQLIFILKVLKQMNNPNYVYKFLKANIKVFVRIITKCYNKLVINSMVSLLIEGSSFNQDLSAIFIQEVKKLNLTLHQEDLIPIVEFLHYVSVADKQFYASESELYLFLVKIFEMVFINTEDRMVQRCLLQFLLDIVDNGGFYDLFYEDDVLLIILKYLEKDIDKTSFINSCMVFAKLTRNKGMSVYEKYNLGHVFFNQKFKDILSIQDIVIIYLTLLMNVNFIFYIQKENNKDTHDNIKSVILECLKDTYNPCVTTIFSMLSVVFTVKKHELEENPNIPNYFNAYYAAKESLFHEICAPDLRKYLNLLVSDRVEKFSVEGARFLVHIVCFEWGVKFLIENTELVTDILPGYIPLNKEQQKLLILIKERLSKSTSFKTFDYKIKDKINGLSFRRF